MVAFNCWKGPKIKNEPKDRFSGVRLPFIQGTTDKIAKILEKHKIPWTFRPLNTLWSFLSFLKDSMHPKNMKGVYVIPYSCETPYIGESDCWINQRIHEHAADIKHGRTRSSALVEHAKKIKHHIYIEEAQVIARVNHFHHRKFKEALEIERRPNNLKRGDGWKINRSGPCPIFLV